MGFGLLLAGYLFTFLLSQSFFGGVMRLIGCILMLMGSQKLKDYFTAFSYTSVAIGLLGVCSIYDAVMSVESFFELAFLPTLPFDFAYLRFALIVLFKVSLLISVRMASKVVGLPELIKEETSDLVVFIIYIIFYIVACFVPQIPPVVVIIADFVPITMTIVLLFHCYRWIAPEDDDFDEDKPSKLKSLDYIVKAMKKTHAEGIRYGEEIKNKQDQKKKNKKK